MVSKGQRVYVVEDESDIAELIRYNMSLEGYNVESFTSGEEGLQAVESNPPDLVILDLMLPGVNGLEICRILKGNEATKSLPIIMVTAKGEEGDIIKGLEMGADDYITKPFSPKVLSARVHAVLRRSQAKTEKAADERGEVVEMEGLLVHPGRHEVKVKDEKVALTHSEFQILHFLAQRPGWVFTRTQIVDAIRGDNYAVTDRSIDFQMVGLRKKLGEMGNYIETVRGVGYRFREASSVQPTIQ